MKGVMANALHPLVDFIYSEFENPLGDLLLAGYGRPPGGRKESFEFHAPWREKAARTWFLPRSFHVRTPRRLFDLENNGLRAIRKQTIEESEIPWLRVFKWLTASQN